MDLATKHKNESKNHQTFKGNQSLLFFSQRFVKKHVLLQLWVTHEEIYKIVIQQIRDVLEAYLSRFLMESAFAGVSFTMSK